MTNKTEWKLTRRAAISALGIVATGAIGAGGARAATPADKVTIYHIEGRRSQRIIWLCEELGIPYEVMFKPGDTMASMNMMKAINPNMPMFPTVIFRGKTMVESGGIMEYLMSQFPGGNKLAPAISSPDYADYKMWIHYAEGTAACRLHAEGMRIMRERDNSIKPGMIGGVARVVGAQDVVDYLERYISTHAYFGGRTFSAADIMLDFVMTAYIRPMPFNPTSYVKLNEWQGRIQQRPAFQRAMKAGAPGKSAPKPAPKPQ